MLLLWRTMPACMLVVSVDADFLCVCPVAWDDSLFSDCEQPHWADVQTSVDSFFMHFSVLLLARGCVMLLWRPQGHRCKVKVGPQHQRLFGKEAWAEDERTIVFQQAPTVMQAAGTAVTSFFGPKKAGCSLVSRALIPEPGLWGLVLEAGRRRRAGP